MPQATGVLAAGTLLAAGISSPADNSVQFLDMYKSTDLGRTWTFLSHVTSAPNAAAGDPVWEPFIAVVDSKVIVYYSDERDPAHSQKLVHETFADGVTWSAPVDDVALADSILRPGMPVIAQLLDGRYIMTYEIAGLAGTPDFYQISSNPESWNVTSAGTQFASGGSPYVVRLTDGRIAVDAYDGTNNILINTKTDLTGSWVRASTPIQSGYSRQILPLADGRLFFTSCQRFWESGMHSVSYADMVVPALSSTAKLLKNVATGLAIDGWGAFAPGADTKQNASNNGFNEQWTLVAYGSNYLIQNSGTGLYLDGYGRTANGSTVAQHTLTYSTNQQWVEETIGTHVKFRNAATGLYLDGAGSTGNGTNLSQYSSSASTNQQWDVLAPPN